MEPGDVSDSMLMKISIRSTFQLQENSTNQTNTHARQEEIKLPPLIRTEFHENNYICFRHCKLRSYHVNG